MCVCGGGGAFSGLSHCGTCRFPKAAKKPWLHALAGLEN